MNLSFFEPYVELRPFIHYIWVFESPLGMPSSESNLAAPNGCSKLIINCENSIISEVQGTVQHSKEQEVYFVGNRDIPVKLSTPKKKTGFIGIEFYPHGAYPIFGIPMVETANQLLNFDVLFGKWGRKVNETVCSLNGAKYKVDFIQRQLIEILRQNQLKQKRPISNNNLVEFSVNSLKSTNGLMPISVLVNKTGYSKRYLEILFKNHIGFSPKVLAGIFRFQKFYKNWGQGRPYGEIKNELNDYYYDQAHYIKDFKRMTGFSPKSYSQKVTNEFGRRLSLR
ncbi:MAG: DUF6597 domain-containing transcriptional factor [Ignavibacteriaceae bacterium]